MKTKIQSSFFEDLDTTVHFNAPIGDMTYFELGGLAEVLALPQTINALTQILNRCYNDGVSFRVLGKGANLLVDDAGVDGVVVKLDHACFTSCTFEEEHAVHSLCCMAGADLSKTLMQTARAGLHGLEGLAGIPASIGGGIRMNAGGKHGCIGDSLSSVQCMTSTGELVSYPSSELHFAYRRTNIVEPIIISGTFTLTPEDPIVVRNTVKEIFAWKKSMQPLADRSAGCAFKNPIQKNGEQISAGKLIDECDLKGFCIGGATINHQHANFITTNSSASAQNVIAIMQEIEKRVFDNTGINLQREVVVWSRNTEHVQ